MFTPAAIASEVARHRHHDFVARADRYRLSRRVNHPSHLSVWRHLRASLLRWRSPSGPSSERHRHRIWGQHVPTAVLSAPVQRRSKR